MDKKITLYTGQKKLFDKLSDEKLALIFRNILKELDSQEVEPISDPAADMLYTVLSAEIVPVDGRSISSKINGNKHKKKAKCVLASETQKGAISEDLDFSLNYKIKNKEVNINKGNNTQEDISTNVDNLPSYSEDNNINSLNKDGRNINISPIEKRGSENPETGKKPSKESSPFDPDPAMNEVIELWMAYKKERKQSYKSLGQKGFINKLKHLSDNNAETARKIVEQSIANNWAGIFPLKNYSSPCNTTRKPMEVGVIMQKEDMDYSSNFTDGW